MLLRPAVPEDAMGVARVHVRAWQAAYRTLLPDAYLDALRPEDRAGRYDFANGDPLLPKTLVALEDGVVCGFATTSPASEPGEPGTGELSALHVDPDRWGRGVGAALVTAARGRLLEQGFAGALLWVLVGNRRAERFYRLDGWLPDGASRTATVWGMTVDEVRYRRALAAPP